MKRFSGPGFTGEYDETGAEGDGQLLDDAEIRNAQLGQHAADSLRLSSAGMLREQRIDQLFELALRACTDQSRSTACPFLKNKMVGILIADSGRQFPDFHRY